MARLIKTFLIVIVIGTIGIMIYLHYNNDLRLSWNYDLPNNYVIKKINEYKFKVGYKYNNDFYLELDNKKIGLEIHIAEFQYSDNFVGLKCAESNKDSINVLFYIIDTFNQNIYGPYNNEEIYIKVQDSIMNGEIFNDFQSTLEIPKGSYKN